ncbi:N-acetylmuramic acid 6-phosphate etherase [Paenibacillus sp. WLX2291]|uniref:N-acetylmuramic acid 6-phosphate etherase n=1 Tax=Paenibacillus sp. WLX2291 TaxID=3296934 RepID=UPI003983F9C2
MKPPIGQLVTEQQNPRTIHIDEQSTEGILHMINREDRLVPAAVEACIPHIAAAVDLIVERFAQGGRLLYVGAGSSGRLGILDAAECPPTYGTDPQQVVGLIAGGQRAIQSAVEGAEDNVSLGRSDLLAAQIRSNDTLVGIAASGRTPYVIGAMMEAREQGAAVVGISNNPGSEMGSYADVMIEAVTGPEVVLGSTRMKAGTSQKMILNMLTTASMIRSGKVYRNLMIDMQPTNEKLVNRAKRLIMLATDANEQTVERVYVEAGGHMKTAIVMILLDVAAEEATQLLAQTNGNIGKAVQRIT